MHAVDGLGVEISSARCVAGVGNRHVMGAFSSRNGVMCVSPPQLSHGRGWNVGD